MSAIFDSSSIPKITIRMGISAGTGTYRTNSTIGCSTPSTTLNDPIQRPRGTPTAAANAKPAVVKRCGNGASAKPGSLPQEAAGGIEAGHCVSIGELLAPPPWSTLLRITHGGGGAQTSILCGYLHSDDRLFDPEANVFPEVFVVHPPTGAAANWVRTSIEYAMTQTDYASPTDGRVSTRIPEFLLIEVLRLYLASAPGADHDWLAALHDPVLGPAMAAMHRQPEHKWTVAELAAQASVSRTALDERFHTVLRRPPIRYLNEWRMYIAQDLLATTDLTVAAVARRVGYDAEEAFSRAFKRHLGQSPRGWRALGDQVRPGV